MDSDEVDLHVRTTIDSFYSYIEAAAVKIGGRILELDGVDKIYLDGQEVQAPVTFIGNHNITYTYRRVEDGGKKQIYSLESNKHTLVQFRFYLHYLTLNVVAAGNSFHNTRGLLGSFKDGSMITRDGLAFKGKFDEYAFEWQVNPEDPVLFREQRSPQLPMESCRLPTAGRPARRLRANTRLLSAATEACAAATSGHSTNMDLCIDDVMVTGEVGLASVW